MWLDKLNASKSGPNIEPCGTPILMFFYVEFIMFGSSLKIFCLFIKLNFSA